MAAIAGKVRSVTAQQRGLGVEGAAGDNPSRVGPPGAVVRGVRVAVVVGVLMVDAVSGDPEDGSAFQRHGAAGGDEVLQPLGRAVAAMREQAMVGHADAHVDGEEIGDAGHRQVGPGEAKQRGDGADMEQAHDDGGDPVDAAVLVLPPHAQVLLHLAGHFSGELARVFDACRSNGRSSGGAAAGWRLGLGFGCFESRGHRVSFRLKCMFSGYVLGWLARYFNASRA